MGEATPFFWTYLKSCCQVGKKIFTDQTQSTEAVVIMCLFWSCQPEVAANSSLAESCKVPTEIKIRCPHLRQINSLPLQHLGDPRHPLLQPGERLLLVELPDIEISGSLTLRHHFQPLGRAENDVCGWQLCFLQELVKRD